LRKSANKEIHERPRESDVPKEIHERHKDPRESDVIEIARTPEQRSSIGSKDGRSPSFAEVSVENDGHLNGKQIIPLNPQQDSGSPQSPLKGTPENSMIQSSAASHVERDFSYLRVDDSDGEKSAEKPPKVAEESSREHSDAAPAPKASSPTKHQAPSPGRPQRTPVHKFLQRLERDK
jgi:hypothetical protein